MLPRISIVTPSFNQGQFIEKTICSVLDQNYPNLEYVVIDGGSTDETVEIIKKYEKHLTYWVSEPDRGQSHAINKGLAHCTGDVFNFLNSDDYLEPGALFHVAEAWNEKPDAAAWVGATKREHSEGRVGYISYPNGLWPEHLCLSTPARCLYQPSTFLNMKFVKELKGVDENLDYCMDTDIYFRLFEKGAFQPGKGIWSAAVEHQRAKSVRALSEIFIEMSAMFARYGYAEGAKVALARSRCMIQPYAMPRSLRKRMNAFLLNKSITKDIFATPFSFDRRYIITIVLEKNKLTQEYLSFLQSCLQEVLHRFPFTFFNILHREQARIAEMITLPNMHYEPDPFTLLEQTKIFIVLDEDAQVDIPRMNRAGIPVVLQPDLAARYGLIDGESCFTADNPYDMVFKAILLHLDNSVWGNISTQSIIHGHEDEGLGKPDLPAKSPGRHSI
ncbi:Glycosyltransferase involved in cell wall bisynthesis [Desulfonatronum zhilinae]|nr:Glycosyltransferase involved in cell wall bisynthesis [Desulfonatronum zhilinae]